MGPCAAGLTRTLRFAVLSGAFFAAYGLAFQSAAPNQSGAPQGGSFSSGAPANTAGEQGAFTWSGAPANTAGPQLPVAATPPTPDLAPFLADPETKLAGVAEAEETGNLQVLRQYLKDTDPAIQRAAFEALLAEDPNTAVQDLLSIIRDTGQLTRVQTLELLTSSPGVDEQTILAALRSRVADQDPLV